MSIFSRNTFLAISALALAAFPLQAQDNASAPADNGATPAQDNGGAAPAPDETGAAESSASFQTFYDALGDQGTWIQSNDYGYVWQPTETDPDWAPYTEGHWVYTDAGWTWVSDEPWGWATYHYGRWVNFDGTGWCWVPGYTWAPAWVSWRYGNGYAGWAPLPPDSFVGVDYTDDGYGIGVGFHIGGDCDDFYGIGPGWYCFLPVTCLGYHSYHGYYRPRGDNYAIINQTTNVTNVNVRRGGAEHGHGFGHVTTGGPMLAQVNAVSSQPIQRANLVQAAQPGGGGALNGDSLTLFAPRVAVNAAGQPERVGGSIGRASINRGTDIMRPLAVNAGMGGAVATETQVQQARIAQNHAPASAKVMTDASTVQPVLVAPLTSMKPVVSAAPPEHFLNTTTVIPNQQRAPSVYGNSPEARTYPQTEAEPGGSPARTYYQGPVTSPPAAQFQPHVVTPNAGGGTSSPTYPRPAGGNSPAPNAPVTHEAAGGGGYSNGGASRTQSGGGTSGNGGSYHGAATPSSQSQSH